jgi:hypothetical protein
LSPVLAYAFWHWKRPEVAPEVYEARQREFQTALAEHPPEGFIRGSTARLDGAPWAAGGGAAYEDWYVIRGMDALDSLNQAAVSAARQAPHDAVAGLAAGGIAGLYGLRAGSPISAPTLATWFRKPPGLGYQALFDTLRGIVATAPATLWMRQMTLGPTPEFCLHSMAPVELPPGITGHTLTLEPVWPAAD